MNLTDLGFSSFFQNQISEDETHLLPARISTVHGDRVALLSANTAPPLGAMAGKLLDRGVHPSTGDWALIEPASPELGVIRRILDRHTEFSRPDPGDRRRAQIIASNVDTIGVVTSANQDFNLRRLERYLFAIQDAGSEAIVVLSKADIPGDSEALLSELAPLAASGVPILVTSALTGLGVERLRGFAGPGRTLALAGSSGVGKSSLINALLGESRQNTGEIRLHDDTGKHTTTRRDLLPLPGGGILLDTPGLREMGVRGEAESADAVFVDLDDLAAQCRWRDCRHGQEEGCAIQAAIEAGDVDGARFRSWRGLIREAGDQRRREAKAAVKQQTRGLKKRIAEKRGGWRREER